MKKTLFALILSAVILSTGALYGCSSEKEPSSYTVTIAADGTSEYSLIRPDESSEELWRSAGLIHKAVNNACGENTLSYTTDWVNRGESVPVGTKEILFGLTNRPESKDVYELIPDRVNNLYDFAIKVYDGRIAIAGGSDAALYNAAVYFNENFIKDGKVEISSDFEYVYKHPFPEIKIGDKDINELVIAYPYDRHYQYKLSALRLNEQLEKSLGFTLPITEIRSSKSVENAIVLKYAPTLEYNISVTDDGNLEISGTPEAVEYAVSDYSEFIKNLAKSSEYKKGEAVASENHLTLLRNSSNAQTPVEGSSAEHGRRAYAYHIIDDDNVKHWSGLMSSWDYDGRGAGDKTSYHFATTSVTDTRSDEPSYLTRQITPQSEGIITFEAVFNCSSDGAVIELCNTKRESALYMETVDGKICLSVGGVMTPIADKKGTEQYLKVNCSFEDGTNEIILNGKNLGTFSFSSKCSYVDRLRFGTAVEKSGMIAPAVVKMYANYLVAERFIAAEGEVDWNDIYFFDGSCEVKRDGGMNGSNYDSKSLSVNAKEFDFVRKFEKTSGKVVFESKVILPKRVDGLTFALTSEDKQIVAFKTNNFGIFTGDGLLLRDYYTENVWHTLRIEADTRTGKAVMKMNGKVLDEVYLETSADYFDGISIAYEGENTAEFRLDEIFCFAEPDVENYVPEPVISDDDEYVVGINICSLWREGTHSGWDKISAYDEIKPLLGFYDEGVPEVQDWEIKWMREHGIDFQLFCWYASSPNVPMMHTHLNDALMNGYMNARYSDRMKFALLWECANAARPKNSDDFRSNFIPYWVEHYLSDERYMSIDGKAVLAIFGASQLINELGGTDACKAEFDYFREICEDLGYEGAIIMACSSDRSANGLNYLKSAGFDAVYAYNWGKTGFNPDFTLDAITSQMKQNAIHVVPTLSTGFNNVGWAATRSPNMTVEDFDGMLDTFKNDLLTAYENESDEWKDNFIMLSTWNEYGEGTYIMPSGLNGFGYVDAVRSNYGDETAEHNDIIPDEEQLSRFTQMYSPERNTLEPLYRITPEIKGEKLIGYDFENNGKDRNAWDNAFSVSYLNRSGNSIDGSSSASDFAIKPADISKLKLNLDEIAGIKVVMKVDKASNATFFFTTTDDGNWNGDKGLSVPVTPTEDYVEYVFDARNLGTWTGTLDELRFDPLDCPGSFSIKSIDFYLNEPDRLYLNGNPVSNLYGYEKTGDNIYCAVIPQSGMPGKLGIAYRWNKAEKKLTLYNANGSVTFTVGSDKAVTNVVDVYGFETDESLHEVVALSKAVGEIDGLPVICINELADIFGIVYELVDDTYIDMKIK